LALYISDLLRCLIARDARHNQLNEDHVKQQTIRQRLIELLDSFRCILTERVLVIQLSHNFDELLNVVRVILHHQYFGLFMCLELRLLFRVLLDVLVLRVYDHALIQTFSSRKHVFRLLLLDLPREKPVLALAIYIVELLLELDRVVALS